MARLTLRSVSAFVFGLALFGYTNDSKADNPGTVAESKKFGTAPGTCEVIEFEGSNSFDAEVNGLYALYSEGTPVYISAQQRNNKGEYEQTNTAMLYNTNQGGAFVTPNADAIRPMGNVLTAGKSNGKASTLYDKGSRLEVDFSEMGSITLNAIHVLDITKDEADSKLELLDNNGNVIKTYKLPVTGAHGATRLNTEGTPGVAKIRVTFGGDGTKSGSGAIDVIEFCRS